MWLPIRIFDREADAEQQRTVRERLARSMEALKGGAQDSFLGRKTQEPFPSEDDPIDRPDIQNLINSELKPPR